MEYRFHQSAYLYYTLDIINVLHNIRILPNCVIDKHHESSNIYLIKLRGDILAVLHGHHAGSGGGRSGGSCYHRRDTKWRTTPPVLGWHCAMIAG